MTTIYTYSGIKVIYEKVIETGVETKYIGSIAKIENGVTTYYHVDHFGSTRQMTDSSGNALFTDYLIYKPFGEIYSGNAGDERYLFNGKEKDVTELYYYGARYYDPKIGRFISQDVVPSVNRYVYVENNPLKYIDPSGMISIIYTCNGNCVYTGITRHYSGQRLVSITVLGSPAGDGDSAGDGCAAWEFSVTVGNITVTFNSLGQMTITKALSETITLSGGSATITVILSPDATAGEIAAAFEQLNLSMKEFLDWATALDMIFDQVREAEAEWEEKGWFLDLLESIVKEAKSQDEVSSNKFYLAAMILGALITLGIDVIKDMSRFYYNLILNWIKSGTPVTPNPVFRRG